MCNANFWRTKKAAEKAYEKWKSLSEKNEMDFVDWLYKEADTALQVSPGDILQYCDSSGKLRYCQVVRLKESGLEFAYLCIDIWFGGDQYIHNVIVDGEIHGCEDREVPPFHFKLPDLPNDLIAILYEKLSKEKNVFGTICSGDPDLIKEKCS